MALAAEVERLQSENSELRARVRELKTGSDGLAKIVIEHSRDWFQS
jgi:cell division protein FtsB